MNKICKICNIEKDISNFIFRRDNQTYRTECKTCKNTYMRKYKTQRYYTDEKFRKKVINEALIQNKKKPKSVIAYQNKKCYQKAKLILPDWYIKESLKGSFTRKEINFASKDILEAKRQIILLKRQIKNEKRPQLCN